jgi:signal transduction histidine kinase
LLKASASQKRIQLNNHVPKEIYLHADMMMFRSILQNLVTNAIKFTPEGGENVSVSATRKDSGVEICVQDFGIGMPQKTIDVLFDKMTSTSHVGTNAEKGTGLGLLLVRDFIVQHGGAIQVESDPQKGTCFLFTLPTTDN